MSTVVVLAPGMDVRADEFTVTSTADSGSGTLREAINDANGESGPDTITLDLPVGSTITLLSDLPEITDPLTVTGVPGAVTVAGAGNAVFHGGFDLSLTGFTVSGGTRSRGGAVDVSNADIVLDRMVFIDNTATDSGGAVNADLGSLTVTASQFDGNDAANSGGAIRHFSMGTRDHSVTISDSTFEENTASSVSIGGGAIALVNGGVTDISGSTFTANTTDRTGGAIYSGGAELSVDDSVFRDNEILNSAGSGGAIYVRDSFGVGGVVVDATLAVTSTTFTGNLSANSSGAIDAAQATVDISTSTFDSNVATSRGGALSLSGGDTDISSTTFVANRASTGDGGAIWANATGAPGADLGSLDVVNSTFSANTAGNDGGAVFTRDQIAPVVRHSTFTKNAAADSGGAIHVANPFVIEHTVLAANTATTAGPDVSGSIASLTWSLVGDTSDATFATESDNLLGVAAVLDPLADNGGPTLTHRPAETSPAIDAGDPTFAAPPATDQRGQSRLASGRIDIGAVEFARGSVSIDPASVTVTEGGSTAFTITRTGGSDGSASVMVATVDGTATAGLDYTAISETLTWVDGVTAGRSVSTTTLEDIADDIDETFEVRLASPVGAALGAPATSVVTITNVPTPFVVPVQPARLADTRDGEITVDGKFQELGRLPAGETLKLDVTGRAGIPDDAQAVVMNITAVSPSTVGYVTIFPCDAERPTASGLNYSPGSVIGNEVVARLSADGGTICLFTFTETHLTVDAVGYVPANSPYRPLTPARLMDTREGEGTVDGDFAGDGLRSAGGEFELEVTRRVEIPESAAAVVVNITAISPQGDGFATVYPCGDRPLASSLNYIAGVTRGNEIVAKLSPTGSLCIYNQQALDFTVDIVGWLPPAASYTAVDPARFVDTRPGETTFDGRLEGFGRREEGSTLRVKIAGRGDVPDDATAAVVNLAAVGPADRGFFTVFDCEGERPLASSLNYVAGVNAANEIIAGLNSIGELCVYTLRDIHMTIDVVGYAS